KTQQLGFLCHEIRNPLNGLMANLTFMAETHLNHEQFLLLETSQQCCMQLRKIVDDVLDLSKIEEGKLQVEAIPFRPSLVVNTVASQLCLALEDKNLELIIDVKGFTKMDTVIVGDPARIMQIVSNFAWNACKFTDQGSVTLVCWWNPTSPPCSTPLVVEPAQECELGEKVNIRFAVIDTGPGIAATTLANLFQPYVQAAVSTTRHHGGTGLGLSICRQLAQLMYGRVWCETNPTPYTLNP
ncbi:histidine kinase-like ATPase, partial [Baffinella frigidus]